MSWIFVQCFGFIPLIASEKMIFEYFFFRKFSLSVATATNQNQRFDQKFTWLLEDYSRNISVKGFSNYLQ